MTEPITLDSQYGYKPLLDAVIARYPGEPHWTNVARKLVSCFRAVEASHVQTPQGNQRRKTKKRREIDREKFDVLAMVAADWDGCPLGQTHVAVHLEMKRIADQLKREHTDALLKKLEPTILVGPDASHHHNPELRERYSGGNAVTNFVNDLYDNTDTWMGQPWLDPDSPDYDPERNR